jgi:alkaline phosphatase D
MVEISETADFSQVALRGYTPVWKDYDNVVKVDTDGHLEPRKTYYYRFVAKTGHVSPTGRFRTLVPEGADLSSLRFAYISCQDYTNGYYNALRFAADEEVDFVIHLGDYVYESVGDPKYQNPLPDREIQLPSRKSKAFTVEDYRKLYQIYKSDPDLRKLHERHAMVSIWDDHEFANDTYYPAVAPDDSLESDPDRRKTANRVWFEYTPARVQFDASKGFEENIRIYRSFKVGNLAEFIFTDERLYRSAHPCGEDTLDRYFTAGCPKMNDPSQTMLGESGQKDWFLNRMRNSDTLWKIWGNEVQFTPLKAFTRYMNLDAWDGFAGERKEITRAIRAAGVKNFITITGDLHTFEAGLIKEDYQNDPDDAAVGVEFMVGSVTSSNLSEMLQQSATSTVSSSNPIPNEAINQVIQEILGVAQPLTSALVDTVVDSLTLAIEQENPWLKLFNSSTHGYCVMELTQTKATWTAFSVSNIKSRHATKSLLFQCEVPKDRAQIHILKK